MADKKISALTGATTPVAGTEVLPIVQGGSTVKVSIANLTAGRAVSTGALTVVGTINGSNYQNLGTQASTGAGAAISFVPSSSLTNWLVGSNYTLSGLFEITPSTAGGGTTFTTPAVTVASTGDTTIKTGNLVIGTSGKGIDFSATTEGSGTMTSELLADYEEGAWTPVLTFNGNSVGTTYTTQRGRYTKVGRTVTVHFEISLSSKGSSTGEAWITGLPFASGQIEAMPVYLYANFNAVYKVGIMYVSASNIWEIAANGTSYFTDAQFTNTSRFWGTCTYQV